MKPLCARFPRAWRPLPAAQQAHCYPDTGRNTPTFPRLHAHTRCFRAHRPFERHFFDFSTFEGPQCGGLEEAGPTQTDDLEGKEFATLTQDWPNGRLRPAFRAPTAYCKNAYGCGRDRVRPHPRLRPTSGVRCAHKEGRQGGVRSAHVYIRTRLALSGIFLPGFFPTTFHQFFLQAQGPSYRLKSRGQPDVTQDSQRILVVAFYRTKYYHQFGTVLRHGVWVFRIYIATFRRWGQPHRGNAANDAM